MRSISESVTENVTEHVLVAAKSSDLQGLRERLIGHLLHCIVTAHRYT